MAKTINFTYKDEDYKLEFTRHSIEVMESQGINISDIGNKIVSSIPMLFRFSFLAHHKKMEAKDIDEMYKLFIDKMALSNALFEMLDETINTLFDDPDDSKNAIKWEVN
ncbi:MAG: DUF5055 domain-containing protein [Coprobacillus sp.]|nr:DUF5055 domain-containing protein [Coprobacillus sp.]